MKTEQLILEKLERIEKKVENIEEHMVDAEGILSKEDYEVLVEYRKEKSENRLKSHEQLKKELGL